MKAAATISLILLLAFTQLGYYFFMSGTQDNLKSEMRTRIYGQLNPSELEIITLTGNQENILWEENGNEFSFKGEMFDLVKKVNENGIELLYCINDVKEKQLVDRYNEITKHNSSGKKEHSNIETITLFEPVKEDISSPVVVLPGIIFSTFISPLQSATFKICVPPPEV